MKWGVRKTKRTGLGGRYHSWRTQRNMKKFNKMISKNDKKPGSILRNRRAYKAEKYLGRAHQHSRQLIKRQAKKIQKNVMSSESDRTDAARIVAGMRAEKKLRKMYGDQSVNNLMFRARFESGSRKRQRNASTNAAILERTNKVIDKYSNMYINDLSTTAKGIDVSTRI